MTTFSPSSSNEPVISTEAAAVPPSVEDVTRLVALLHDEPPARRRDARRPRRLLLLTRRSPEPVLRSVIRSSWLAAVALALCAVTHFPLRHDGVSPRLLACTVGLSVLCTALALILVVRPGAVALAGAVVVPAVLAAAHVHGGSLPSADLSRSVELALAPPWLATPAAFIAALLALAALLVRVRNCGQSCRWGGTGGRSGTP